VQVYLPSAGWIEFDPTNGIVGTRDLIRVAVARDPRQAIPLHGCYLGSADAYVGMEIGINVVSVGDEEVRSGGALEQLEEPVRDVPEEESEAQSQSQSHERV
jgi:transglutaminase-like putative cysteine protease